MPGLSCHKEPARTSKDPMGNGSLERNDLTGNALPYSVSLWHKDVTGWLQCTEKTCDRAHLCLQEPASGKILPLSFRSKAHWVIICPSWFFMSYERADISNSSDLSSTSAVENSALQVETVGQPGWVAGRPRLQPEILREISNEIQRDDFVK